MNTTKMNHIMVDIETMGTESYSAIVSIGALGFDLETGKKGLEFYVNVDLQSCINKGLVVNGNTCMWWMKQSKEAVDSLLNPTPIKIEKALSEFSFWIWANFNSKEVCVWGNSARFDLGILQNAFEKTQLNVPWQFRNERCVRTLVSFAPEVKKNFKHSGIDHNALSDCHKQVEYCSLIWNQIKKIETNGVHDKT